MGGFIDDSGAGSGEFKTSLDGVSVLEKPREASSALANVQAR